MGLLQEGLRVRISFWGGTSTICANSAKETIILTPLWKELCQVPLHNTQKNEKIKRGKTKIVYRLFFLMLVLILIATTIESNPTSAIIPIGVIAKVQTSVLV
jgi:hypothetical protein